MSMEYKSIISYLDDTNLDEKAFIKQASEYDYLGADELLYVNLTKNEEEREAFLAKAKHLKTAIDIPFFISCYVKRFEDIKKALYTGASTVVVDYESLMDIDALIEGTKRFGGDRVLLGISSKLFQTKKDEIEAIVSEQKLKGILLQFTSKDLISDIIKNSSSCFYLFCEDTVTEETENLLKLQNVGGMITSKHSANDIMQYKRDLKNKEINTNTFESSMEFKQFKLNSDGMIPVITQDYKTGEVLMLAYMNEEAYNMTIKTGKMTYYSRSRQELWIKGDTSSHYQYVKQLDIDCDCDTILAKVVQMGAACHTGNRSCFFTNLVQKEFDKTNPMSVLTDDYNVILDRKMHPKEGSYTNYLFDKGIDKILKKCGEEATEITIAAKNPNADELRYEIADYLYHLMVLMAECDLDWNDVMNELVHRR